MMRGDMPESPEPQNLQRERGLRRSPRINGGATDGAHGSGAHNSPPEGPTARYHEIGEDTPTGRARWNDAMEITLCHMWEEEEHLYNSTMDDHRRVDRRRDAIRRIAAHLEVEGMSVIRLENIWKVQNPSKWAKRVKTW